MYFFPWLYIIYKTDEKIRKSKCQPNALDILSRTSQYQPVAGALSKDFIFIETLLLVLCLFLCIDSVIVGVALALNFAVNLHQLSLI